MNKRALASVSVIVGLAFGVASFAAAASAQENIRLRIGSGHPPAITYAGLMQNYFVPEVTKRVAERTDHTVEFIEGYAGAMVKVGETLTGVRDGIIDLGGLCFCFEPANLPLHAFQVMLPFGTTDPELSLRISREVYERVPYMSEVFEDEFNQKLLAITTDNTYDLGTNFEWSDVSQIEGRRIAGAGLNLKWLEYAGATPVQFALPEAYTGLQTGVYDGAIMFASSWLNFKLYEVANVYTQIGFGSVTWYGLTVNRDTWDGLPDDVQEIMLEVADEMSERSGVMSAEDYPKQLEELRGLGATVNEISEDVRREWAQSLAGWPAEIAAELDGQGYPASDVLEATLSVAEDMGYEWPVRYEIK